VFGCKLGLELEPMAQAQHVEFIQCTFALILAVTNRVEHYTQENRNERWAYNKDFCYWDTTLMELAGKTLGIMGLGNIGMKVANIARQFGMNICLV
jgi:glycerate dehydrogenase